MTPFECSFWEPIKSWHTESNISKVKVCFCVKFCAVYFDSCKIWEDNGIRVLFLNNNLEVISPSLIPYAMWSEFYSPSIIVIVHEWWIFLSSFIWGWNINFWHIICLRINKSRQLVFKIVSYVKFPACFDIFNKIRICILFYINLKI